MKIEIDYSDISKLKAKFGVVASKSRKSQKEELKRAGDEFVVHMQNAVAPIRYTGTLEGSIKIHELTNDHVTVGPDTDAVPYTQWVLQGGDPHAAPFEPIRVWTVSKLGGTTSDAWAVWWSIYHHGTSMEALKNYPADGGGYPFPRITMESPDAEKTLVETSARIGKSVIAEITS